MNLKHVAAGAACALLWSASASAANFLPTGPQNDVAYDTVVSTWGWTEVHRSSYGSSEIDFSTALGGGAYVMIGALNVETNAFDVIAAALRTDVEMQTPENATHEANGSLWYWTPTLSFGFAGLGDAIDQVPTDVAGPTERDRLSWRTGHIVGCCHLLNAGGRSGDHLDLNDSTYMRVVLTTDSITAGVPEPATWALMIVGFGTAGAILRRQRPALA